MKVKRIKELLENIDDETEVFIRNSHNICGNISELRQLELSTYGFFGKEISCIILNTENSKQLETNEQDEIIDYIKEK